MKKSKSKKTVSKKPAAKAKKTTPAFTNKSASNKSGVMPLGDRVLVKPLSADESATSTAFGILIPDSAKEKPEQGTVVAVGPGRRSDDGKVMPLGVNVGDRVMFSKYGYDEVKVGGVEYYIIREESILAILN